MRQSRSNVPTGAECSVIGITVRRAAAPEPLPAREWTRARATRTLRSWISWALVASLPFAAATGVELDAAASDEVQARPDGLGTADRCTISGALHGGALMTLADSVAAVCAFLNLPEGTSTSTIKSKTNFYRGRPRPRRDRRDRAPLHVGRTNIVEFRPISATSTDKAARCSPRPRLCSAEGTGAPGDHDMTADRAAVSNAVPRRPRGVRGPRPRARRRVMTRATR